MRINKHLPGALSLSLAVLWSGGLLADNFTIEAGTRHVQKGESDVMAARKTELAISESSGTFSTGQPLALPDDNKFGTNLPFFAMSYRKDFGGMGLQFGLAYESLSGNYSYTVSDVPGRSGSVTTINGTGGEWKQKEQNRDMEIGLRLPVKEGVLFLTPRIGTRLSQLDVTGSDTSLSNVVNNVSGNNITTSTITSQAVKMTGDATGNYAGLNLDWNLSKLLELYVSYTLLPGLDGSLDRKTGDNIAIGTSKASLGSVSVSGSTITIPLYWKSGYKVDGNILDAGLKWKIGEVR